MVNTITERQSAFLTTLVAERETTATIDIALENFREQYRKGEATRQDASTFITVLLARPKKTRSIEAGIYEEPDSHTLYRVYLGQNSGKMLCKRVLQDPVSKEVTYEYMGVADRHLTNARRLTRQEVAEHTLSYGITDCLVCGRRLDDPESVDRGIGPVCWENYS